MTEASTAARDTYSPWGGPCTALDDVVVTPRLADALGGVLLVILLILVGLLVVGLPDGLGG